MVADCPNRKPQNIAGEIDAQWPNQIDPPDIIPLVPAF